MTNNTMKTIKLSLEKAKELYGKDKVMDALILENFTEGELTGGRAQRGYSYFFLCECNAVESNTENGDGYDEGLFLAGNYYKTEQEALDEVTRRKSIANAYVPKEGEMIYRWAYYHQEVINVVFNKNYTIEAYVGACFPYTKEGKKACEEFGRDVAPLFIKN